MLETEAMVTGWAGERPCRSPHPAACAPSPPTRSSWPPVRASGRDRPGSSPVIGRTACTPPASCRTWCTCIMPTSAAAPSIVGAELVSWSAVLTLREAGCATVAMVSGYPRAEAYAAFRMLGRVPDERTGADPQPGGRHPRQGPGALRHRREAATPARAPPSSATRRVHRRLDPRSRAGPHRRPGDGRRDPRPCRGRRACGPAGPGCSPSATCCTRSTPPTAPLSTAATSRRAGGWLRGRDEPPERPSASAPRRR